MHQPSSTQAFTHTTRHAHKRLQQRTALSEAELRALLDAGAFVDVGRKPGCDRQHLLFWSATDRTAFVALRDTLTGSVVTVLPLDYHARLAWCIGDAEIERARQRAARKTTGPGRLRLSVHYLDEEGRLKTHEVWRATEAAEVADPMELASIRACRRHWRDAIERSGIHPTRIVRASLRRSSHGSKIDLPEDCLAHLLRPLLRKISPVCAHTEH